MPASSVGHRSLRPRRLRPKLHRRSALSMLAEMPEMHEELSCLQSVDDAKKNAKPSHLHRSFFYPQPIAVHHKRPRSIRHHF